MNRLAHTLAAAGLLVGSGAAIAQSVERDSAQLRVAADAGAACVVDSARAVSASNATFRADGRGGGTIAITELVDPTTAQPRAATIELALPVVCNAAHRVVIASSEGGLQRIGGRRGLKPGRDGFGDMLPYAIGFTWGGNTGAGTSEDARFGITQSAETGEFRLRIDTSPTSGFLTAGIYSDALTIEFEPAN